METSNRPQQPVSTIRRAATSTLARLFHADLLLVFVPLGFAAHWARWPDTLVTLSNVLAIMPLSARLSDASDTMGDRWGSLIGGLINATFGNTVELIVSIYTTHMAHESLATKRTTGGHPRHPST